MSKNFKKVKTYYDMGLWSKQKVYNVVGKWITAEEYEQIVREPFHQGD